MDELAAHARLGNFVRDCGMELLAPRRCIWPAAPATFPMMAEAVSVALPETWDRLFFEFILASHLLAPTTTPSPVLSWLKMASVRPGQTFPVGWEKLHLWCWGVVPLPLLDRQRRGVLRHALLGVEVSGGTTARILLPPGFEDSLDPAARQAITTAVSLVGESFPGVSLVIWPLLRPDAVVYQIEQGSIALPLFLALMTLCQGGTLPPILATGCLDPDGSLRNVDGLKPKYTLVTSAGCHSFLYPVVGGIDPLNSEPDFPGDRLPVSRRDSALLQWNCYRSDGGAMLKECIDCLDKPQRLLELLPEIPGTMLPLPEELSLGLKRSIGSFITQNPDAATLPLTLFCEKLDVAMARDSNPAWIRELLSLLPPDLVRRLGEHAPRIGFRLSQLQLFAANRSGQVAEGVVWEGLSGHFREAKSAIDPEDDRHAIDNAIHSFIVSRHNAFKFSTDDLQKFLEEIRGARGALEEQLLSKRRRVPDQTDRNLGGLYGLIAQHHAYCGSLDEALAYSDKALDAFGHGTSSPLLKDCGQQFTYRVYIYLEAGDYATARETLQTLLGISSLKDFDPSTVADPYHHAAIARYLVESEESLDGYCRWALEHLPVIRQESHPWQLWSYHMGRIVTNKTQKYSLLSASRNICSRPDQPTLQIMALLPLSELWRERLLSDDELMAAVQDVVDLLASGSVDVAHFSPLLGKKWHELLEYVAENRCNLFPFNYS